MKTGNRGVSYNEVRFQLATFTCFICCNATFYFLLSVISPGFHYLFTHNMAYDLKEN